MRKEKKNSSMSYTVLLTYVTFLYMTMQTYICHLVGYYENRKECILCVSFEIESVCVCLCLFVAPTPVVCLYFRLPVK